MKTHSLASRIRPGIAALLLALAAPASAQSIEWTGVAGGDWADAANWADGGVTSTTAPVSGTVHIQNGAGPVVSGSTSASLSGLYVGTTGSGGSLTLADAAAIAVGGPIQMAMTAGDRASLLITGNASLGGGDWTLGYDAVAVFTGTVTGDGRLTAGGVLLLGYGGTSSLTATGSSSLSAGTLNLGRTIGSKGVVTLAGSSSMSALNVNLGYYRGSGELAMTDNAVLATAGNASLGATDGASNNATTSGGVATLGGSSRWTIGGALSVGNFYRGELTIGENATVTAGRVVIGALQGSAANMKGHGIVTLNGDAFTGRGTLETASVTRGAGLSGTLAFNGGILRATRSDAEFLGASTSGATLVVTTGGDGAFIDSNGFDIGASAAVTFDGAGGLTKLGAGSLTLGGSVAYAGDTVVEAGSLILAAAGQLVSSRAVAVAAGATLDGGGADQTLKNLSGAGAVNLGSGKLTVNSDDDTAFTGVITAAGGLRKTGAGALSLGGDNTIGGLAEVTEGVLGIGHARALGASDLVLAGGATLRADATVGIANALAVRDAPLFLDTAGAFTLGIGGPVSGTLGVVKNGAGDIVFSNDSTALSGAIAVNEGGLMVAGLGATAVTVAGGAGFGGSGDIHGDVTFTGGGFIQLGPAHNDSRNITPATLNILGALTLGGDLLVKYDTYGAGAADRLAAGGITLGGALAVDFAGIREGVFSLISVGAGSLDPALPGSIVTSRNGVLVSNREVLAYSLPNPQTLQVAIAKTNAALTWTGADGGDWNYNTAASWSGADTRFIDGDRVIFDGTDSAGSGTIAIEANGVTAADMTVTGGRNYNFTGSGRITTDAASVGSAVLGFDTPAGGRFTMRGTGTVAFENGSNVFQNGIVVESGVVAGSARALGIGAAAVIDNSGTLVFRQEENDTYSRALTGAGVFVKTGSAALFLDSPDSAPAGAVNVDEGALYLTDTARLGAAAVTVAGGATFGGSGSAATVGVLENGVLQVGLATAGPAVGAGVLRLAGVTLEDNARVTGAGVLDAPVSIGFRRTGVVEVAGNRFLVATGSITGSGGLLKRGAGDLVFSGKAGYTGDTTIEDGRLVAGAAGVFAAGSHHTIRRDGVLWLGGLDQTLRSVTNAGIIAVGGAAPGAAGARLDITGDYTGVATGTPDGIIPAVIGINLVASDGAPTAVDTVHVGGAIRGTTTLLVNVTDNRAATAAGMLTDIGAIITRGSGDMPAGVFTLTDGDGDGRIVIGLHDYGLYYCRNEARIVATTSAEVPAVLAVNAAGLAANRAALASLGRRLDQIRPPPPAGEKITRPFQLWTRGHYSRDKFDDTLFNNARTDTQGVQLGGDYSFKQQAGGLVAIGFLVDCTGVETAIPVTNDPATRLDSTGAGAYVSVHSGPWHVDAAMRYSWDNYTLDVSDTPSFDMDGFSWDTMLRVSYSRALAQTGLTLVPSAQVLYQRRTINNTTDAYGRVYHFGPRYDRIEHPASFEWRLGASAQKIITLAGARVFAPYVSVFWSYDLEGAMTVTSVNGTLFHSDLGGSGFLLDAGIPMRFGGGFELCLEASVQTGGKVQSHGVSLGLNWRW